MTEVQTDKDAILQGRAEAAARLTTTEDAGDSIEVVVFEIAGERHAIESIFIREVYPLKQITPLPGTPPFVLGIASVRGQIISVIDVKKYFGLPEQEITESSRIIIVHMEAMEFGVLADMVEGVRIIPLEYIQPPLPTLKGIRKQYLKGVTTDQTVLWDAQKLLGDEGIIVREHAGRSVNI